MVSSKKQAEISEQKILSALLKKSPQTYTELLQTTKMSSRTLHKALRRLEEQGKVLRKIETSGKYPPPVLYSLTEEGKKSLTLRGIIEAYSLGVPKDTLLKVMLEKVKEPEEKINEFKAFLEILDILGPERANTLIDFFDTPLHILKTPLIFSMEEIKKLLQIFMRYEPYRTELKNIFSGPETQEERTS
jgi:DNA-binding Lrp family transcriptional regulator